MLKSKKFSRIQFEDKRLDGWRRHVTIVFGIKRPRRGIA
jgi:hypothetical protein